MSRLLIVLFYAGSDMTEEEIWFLAKRCRCGSIEEEEE